MESPVIQHWIVAVARAAGLDGAEALSIASDTPMEAAWSLTAMRAGVTEEELAARVAAHYRLGVADLEAADVHARRLLPGRLARKLQVLPLRYTDRWLWVASADPVAMDAEREISHVAGRSVHFELAPPGALASAVDAAYPEADEDRHELPPLEQATRGPRVLVVDDDDDVRALLRAALESSGFEVTEASDGVEALALLEGPGAFDLMTLDLKMDRMDGIEVLRTVRSRLPLASLAVVVATGTSDPAVEMELFEAGADDFVVKPVDPRRFILRVQAVLRRRAPGFLAGL